MELSGETRIDAPRQKVWDALNDPAVLRACIPGCESLTREGDDRLAATLRVKIGPVKSTFRGSVMLSNMRPPEGYTISGEGDGGVAGMAKGGADVTLAEDGAATLLTYNAKADVGGKLAQIGSRLIKSTAQKYANDFFGTFGDIVSGKVSLEEMAPAEPAVRGPSKAGRPAAVEADHVRHLQRLNWALLAIIALLAAALIFD